MKYIKIIFLIIVSIFILCGCSYRSLENGDFKWTDFSVWTENSVDNLKAEISDDTIKVELENHDYNPEKIDEILEIINRFYPNMSTLKEHDINDGTRSVK